ncbi:TRAP transporter permease [Chloroflexota bacterium]
MISLILPAMAMIVALIYVFHIVIFGRIMLDYAYFYLLVALLLPLVIIWTPIRKGATKDRLPWYDVLLVCLCFAAPFYFFLKTDEILLGWVAKSPLYVTITAAIFWIVVMEAARRAVNNLFGLLILVMSTYPLFAFIVPGMLRSSHFSLVRTINYHTFGEVGIMGIPMHVFGTVLFGFMVFSIGIQITGVGSFFNELALALLGKTRGGTAKVAIVASGFFASVSGSGLANIFTTGPFTIPAMKREGLPAHFAAAVEATASSGGPLMPPIMGAAAFIMAELLEVTYVHVAIAAFVPILLYYLTIFAQIDGYAARVGLVPRPIAVTAPKIRWILFANLHILIGFCVLVYLLFVMYLIPWAPWIATMVVFALAMVRKKTRLYPRDLLNFLEDVGRLLGDLISIIASIGLIIGALILTGIAFSLPYSIISLAQGNVYYMLLLGAAASFIMGMGVPLLAAYIFLAIVLVPGLVTAGLDPFAAHLFVMYGAMMSYITPPVALGAYTAALIADANPLRTAFQAMRLGIGKYFLPFFFVLSPSLILRGSLLDSLQTIPTCALGMLFISGGLEGYVWRIGTIGIPMRILFFASGFLLAFPNTATDIWGGGLAAVLIVGYLIRKVLK